VISRRLPHCRPRAPHQALAQQRRRGPRQRTAPPGQIDIVNLVVGEPDFDTPVHIRQAACAAIEKGATRYTLWPARWSCARPSVAKLLRENGLATR
jgi:aspartate/methionine/tyrosine aminotransferase